jgi:hypothetical protein
VNDTARALLFLVWWIGATEFGEYLYRRTPAHLHPRLDCALFWIVAVTYTGWIIWQHWQATHWTGPMPMPPCVPPTCTP